MMNQFTTQFPYGEVLLCYLSTMRHHPHLSGTLQDFPNPGLSQGPLREVSLTGPRSLLLQLAAVCPDGLISGVDAGPPPFRGSQQF